MLKRIILVSLLSLSVLISHGSEPPLRFRLTEAVPESPTLRLQIDILPNAPPVSRRPGEELRVSFRWSRMMSMLVPEDWYELDVLERFQLIRVHPRVSLGQ